MSAPLSLRRLATSCLSAYYKHVDPWWQKIRLGDYSSDIRSIIEGGSRTDSGIYCVFVYYETDGVVSRSVQNILAALLHHSVNTVVVTNAALSQNQLEFLRAHSHTLLLRGNQGFDFGAYKDCIAYLEETTADLSRLILLNDSVYYFSDGLNEFVSGLLEDVDSIAAFENWDPIHAYHLQSFALSVSSQIFRHPAFTSFWAHYTPVNNRLYAIERGEKRLSKACLKASNSTRIIYSTGHALEASRRGASQFEPFEFLISSPIDIRQDKARALSSRAPTGDLGEDKTLASIKILSNVDGIYRGSPIHAGMMFFVWYTNCPMVKKDVVYREQFRFWEVEYILRKRFDNEEIDEFLTMVRKKGTLKGLEFLNQIKVRIGAA